MSIFDNHTLATFTCSTADVTDLTNGKRDDVEVSATGEGAALVANDSVYKGTTVICLDAKQLRELAKVLVLRADEVDAARSAEPETAPAQPVKRGYVDLGTQAQLVHRHMARAGSISAREAMNDHGITSATLARRICDIEEAGIAITRTRKVHPITHKRYTRYAIAPVQTAA